MKWTTFVIALLCAIWANAQNTNLGTNAGNSGLGNTSIGHYAGDAVSGNNNSFLGTETGEVVTSGSNNTALGSYAGRFSTTANNNTFVGHVSGYSLTTGGTNTFLGVNTGYLGNGSGNVFIGYSAGYNETGSNKLYIDNSNTATPLIYGDFNTNKVGINALPGSYTLNVGGTLNASSVYINGAAVLSSQWTTSGSNINFNTGIVSIGTATAPAGYKLAIGGKMVAEEVVIKLQANWPDYVFETGYKLPSLSELEKFILTYKHLPEVPTAADIKRDGISLGEMDAVLLKKIEELTLLLIELQKQVDTLKASRN